MNVPSCSGRSAPHFRCKGRSRQTVFVECNNKFDASLRVKGVKAKVFKYVGDFEHAADWYPGITSVTRVRGEGIALKNQYTVERTILRMQHTSTYEVIDIAPGRKVVYSGTSPLHTAVHELYFMEDPTDRNYTNVRYIKKIQLRNLASPLQPLVKGTMGRIPEQGLVNLAKLLISPDTPLRNIKLDAEEEAEELRAGKKEASWSWQSVWDGLGLGATPGGGSLSGPATVDSLGYYAVLGLDVRRVSQYGADDIKAAYRGKAMEMHPDKVSMEDAATQESASVKFQQLQKAYNVLKNVEHRRLYDSGQLVSELVQ